VPQTDRLSSARLIAAPAASIFRLITDPQGHVDIDGSGMLIAPKEPQRLAAVGDVFLMDMDGPARGLPQLGTYTAQNTVTKLIDDAALEWAVGQEGGAPFGHVYGFTLAPLSDEETEVTHYYDWSAVSAQARGWLSFPVIDADGLAATLSKLDTAVSSGPSA
jgi:hypothetical protein